MLIRQGGLIMIDAWGFKTVQGWAELREAAKTFSIIISI